MLFHSSFSTSNVGYVSELLIYSEVLATELAGTTIFSLMCLSPFSILSSSSASLIKILYELGAFSSVLSTDS